MNPSQPNASDGVLELRKSWKHEDVELTTIPHKQITEDLSSHHHAGSHSHMHRTSGQRKPYHQKLWKTPKETIVAITQAAAKKAAMPLDKLIVLGLIAGLDISLAGVFALVASYGSPSLDPGIQKLIIGVTFPVALYMIVFLGGELFTGNVMYSTVGLMSGTISFRKCFLICSVAYISNFAGCALGAYFLAYLPEMFADDPWLTSIKALAVTKTSHGFGVMVLRGIAANWLVNIAIFVVIAAEDISGKTLALFYPICAFATAGYEHCVANMFYVLTSLMHGADVSFGKFLYANLIPVTIGNCIGGAFFVGFVQWYVYGWRLKPDTPLATGIDRDPSKKPEEYEGHCIELTCGCFSPF